MDDDMTLSCVSLSIVYAHDNVFVLTRLNTYRSVIMERILVPDGFSNRLKSMFHNVVNSTGMLKFFRYYVNSRIDETCVFELDSFAIVGWTRKKAMVKLKSS
jgi:hypothetical protein